jgi:hypothetical protein
MTRRPTRTSRIESVQIHPSLHLDLARERQQELTARAEQERLARTSRPDERRRLRLVARVAARARSVWRHDAYGPTHCPERSDVGQRTDWCDSDGSAAVVRLIVEIHARRCELDHLRKRGATVPELDAKERVLERLRWRLKAIAEHAAQDDLGSAA